MMRLIEAMRETVSAFSAEQEVEGIFTKLENFCHGRVGFVLDASCEEKRGGT